MKLLRGGGCPIAWELVSVACVRDIAIRTVPCPVCDQDAEIGERREFAKPKGPLLRSTVIAFTCPAGCDPTDRELDRLATAPSRVW